MAFYLQYVRVKCYFSHPKVKGNFFKLPD
uniref:Uncharacterized protein n=1 Tax=Arundo donax TaxID=35708 RepID=A0A0A9BSR0_ARUDO